MRVIDLDWNTIANIATTGMVLVAVLALFFHRKALLEEKKTRELQVFDNVFIHIRDLEEKFYVEYYEAPEETRKNWDSLFFNTIEYFSFLVNRKYLSDKQLAQFYEGALKMWYEEIFLKHASQEERDEKIYPEFKKLYRALWKLRRNKSSLKTGIKN